MFFYSLELRVELWSWAGQEDRQLVTTFNQSLLEERSCCSSDAPQGAPSPLTDHQGEMIAYSSIHKAVIVATCCQIM